MRANTKYNRFLDYANHPSVVATLTGLLLLAVSANMASFQIQVRADAQPTPALPTAERILVFATAPAATPEAIQVAAAQPRWVTAWAAPNGDVLGPIPAPNAGAIVARFGDDWLMITWNGGPAWVRAADIGLQITDLKPERVIVVSAPEPSYQVANDPPPSWYTDIATPPPGFVDGLIGDDPNALACGGSPLCGGLTNAQARAAQAGP